jgi:ABC-type multidrug transport system fused ATPase/permease subunit
MGTTHYQLISKRWQTPGTGAETLGKAMERTTVMMSRLLSLVSRLILRLVSWLSLLIISLVSGLILLIISPVLMFLSKGRLILLIISLVSRLILLIISPVLMFLSKGMVLSRRINGQDHRDNMAPTQRKRTPMTGHFGRTNKKPWLMRRTNRNLRKVVIERHAVLIEALASILVHMGPCIQIV